MGDVLHGMPAVAALRAALPGAHIGWVVDPRWAPLLRARSGAVPSPLVDRVHLAQTQAWSKHPLSLATVRSMAALRSALHAERYSIAIDLQGSIRSALIARSSGVPHVTGSSTPRERLAQLLYTKRVAVSKAHVVEQAVEIASAATGLQLQPASFALPVSPEDEAWAGTLAAASDKPLIFLAPTAGWGAKQWPAERFGELARQLHGHGFRILVNASASSPDPTSSAVIAVSGSTSERVACTLPQMIALLRRVRLAIVGDSGPLHLAAALRVPVVALFGPTDPSRIGPFGTRSIVLRHPSSTTSYRHVQQADAGLGKITAGEVLHAALSLLKPAEGMDNG